MNKSSCLSLVSNAILYWDTLKINDIVENLRQQGEMVDDETLAHVSLLPFKQVLPHGTYFIKDVSVHFASKPAVTELDSSLKPQVTVQMLLQSYCEN